MRLLNALQEWSITIYEENSNNQSYRPHSVRGYFDFSKLDILLDILLDD